MAKLWKKLPPLMADNFGFIEVMNKTDGMGVIDDCSEYRTSAERRRGHRRAGADGMRVVHTEISSENVVSGTRQKVLDAFWNYREVFEPQFTLFSAAPCSAMIGTDLEEIAETVEQESGVKAAAVKLSGHKAYDAGISETLLALVKLLAKPGKVRLGSLNILGVNTLDWQEDNTAFVRKWVEEQGFQVIAAPGTMEKAANIEKMSEASVNLAVTASGLAAAKYLKKQYGTPYIAMAPFGKSWTGGMLAAFQTKEQPGNSAQPENGQPEILIISEQLMGNALRETLIRDYGMKNIQVCTFYTLEKTLAWPGDRRIKGEDDAEELLKKGGFHLIIADPLLRSLASDKSRWIDLPHKAFELYGEHSPLPLLFGDNLNQWLEEKGITVEGTRRTIL